MAAPNHPRGGLTTVRRSLVTEPQGKWPNPAELIQAEEAAAVQEHGPVVARRYVGDGLVFVRHASGVSYHRRLPDGSRLQ